MDLRRARFENKKIESRSLTAESIKSVSLPLQGIHDVHGGNGLSPGVLSVGDGITDDVLKELPQNSTSLFIDETREMLDSTTAGKTTDGIFGKTLTDVAAQDLPVEHGGSLSETLSSSRYFYLTCCFCRLSKSTEMNLPAKDAQLLFYPLPLFTRPHAPWANEIYGNGG